MFPAVVCADVVLVGWLCGLGCARREVERVPGTLGLWSDGENEFRVGCSPVLEGGDGSRVGCVVESPGPPRGEVDVRFSHRYLSLVVE